MSSRVSPSASQAAAGDVGLPQGANRRTGLHFSLFKSMKELEAKMAARRRDQIIARTPAKAATKVNDMLAGVARALRVAFDHCRTRCVARGHRPGE